MASKKYQLTNLATGRSSELAALVRLVGPDVLDISTLPKDQGVFTYDPGFMATAATASAITYIDGDAGVLLYRGYPIEQLAKHIELPRGLVPAAEGRAAEPQGARRVHELDLAPHDAERVDPAAVPRLPPRRAPDGDGRDHRRLARGLLPRLDRHQRRPAPRDLLAPDDREAADDRGGGLQARARPALHLPAQRPRLHGEHAAHVLRRALRALRGRPAARQGARPPVHPARRPRAEREHLDRAARRQHGLQPLYGDVGGRLRALGPGARRRQRGRRRHARRRSATRRTSTSSSRRSRTARAACG